MHRQFVVLWLLFIVITSAGNNHAHTVGVDVTVDAAQDWQATDIILEAGDTLYIDYLSGRWRVEPQHAGYDANGHGSFVCDALDCVEPIRGFPAGGLIGRIGEDGAAFAIGNNLRMTAASGGALYLRSNDGRGGLDDNSGTITVRVTHGDDLQTLNMGLLLTIIGIPALMALVGVGVFVQRQRASS